ncbi:hypothetical protein MRX96_012208 [Rhipicephalus microplus]
MQLIRARRGKSGLLDRSQHTSARCGVSLRGTASEIPGRFESGKAARDDAGKAAHPFSEAPKWDDQHSAPHKSRPRRIPGALMGFAECSFGERTQGGEAGRPWSNCASRE